MPWRNSKEVSDSGGLLGVALNIVVGAFKMIQAVWKVTRVVMETVFYPKGSHTINNDDSMSHDRNDTPDAVTPLLDKEDDDSNTCEKCMAAEFHLIDFKLDYKYPGMFAHSQFGGQTLFLVWRVFAAIVTITITGICITLDVNFAEMKEDRVKWLIFFTNWSLLALVSSAVVELAVTIHLQMYRQDLIRGTPGSQPMPWYLKMCWVLYNVSTTTAFCITILFWSILYNPSHGLNGFYITYVFAHIINSVYAFANLLITGIPSRILHFYQPVVFAVQYAMFSSLYQAAGGTNYAHSPAIYPDLNWTQPGHTFGAVVAVLTLTVGLHVAICGVAFVRALVAVKVKAAYNKQSSKTNDCYELQ